MEGTSFDEHEVVPSWSGMEVTASESAGHSTVAWLNSRFGWNNAV